MRRYGAKCVEVGGHQKIFDGVYTTGEMGGWILEDFCEVVGIEAVMT